MAAGQECPVGGRRFWVRVEGIVSSAVIISVKTDRFHFIFTFHMKSFSFHTRLSGPGTSHENTSCNIVFRSLLHENYMKFSQNFQVGGAHTPGGSLRGFLPSLLDRRSASRRGCRGICSGRLMGMCLRCARCSTVSLKTLPEKAPRRFHFRSKFQVKTFQVEIKGSACVRQY